MKATCSECDKQVHVIGRGHLAHHDLCDRCWRTLRQKAVAARLGPKPVWAVRRMRFDASTREERTTALPSLPMRRDGPCQLGAAVLFQRLPA